MTTGGTANTTGTFSKDYASLWDFRPGDDAFDTVEPYLDPYTGLVRGTYACGGDVTVVFSSKSGNTVTVNDPTGLGAGMFLSGTQTTIVSISGNVVTLSAAFAGTTFPTTQTFTRIQPIISVTATLVSANSAQVTLASTTGLQIGQILASGPISGTAPAGNVATTAFTSAPNPAFGIRSLTNVGPVESIAGAQTGNVATNTVNGSNIINVPLTTQVAPGELVTGGITGTVANIAVSADGSFLVVTLGAGQNATVTGPTNVKFDSTPCFPGTVGPPALPSFVMTTTNASAFVVGGVNVPGVTGTGIVACSSFFGDPALNPQLNGVPVNNGIPVTFTFNLGGNIFPVGTTIINIVGNTVTLSNRALPFPGQPLPPATGLTATTNVPLNFLTTGSSAAVTCPMIPFSSRGGASTDPNDGSLWLFGEFAKNRLSTIPGPGQWGTSVANYALSFPAVDPYNNDNTYFQDVPSTSVFFTWIQIAKNLGLAVPSSISAAGPAGCSTVGNPPIQQPPPSGNAPVLVLLRWVARTSIRRDRDPPGDGILGRPRVRWTKRKSALTSAPRAAIRPGLLRIAQAAFRLSLTPISVP